MSNLASLARRVKECSQLSGTFQLRSGVVSDTYFDKYLFESDPVLLREICQEMANLVPDGTELLAGLEMGGIPVVTVLSQVTGIPSAFIRKEPKTHGTRKYAEGPSLAGKKVLIIEDVVSSGGAILDAIEKLKADSVVPTGILCVLDRETGGAENLAKAGFELKSVFRMSDLESQVRSTP